MDTAPTADALKHDPDHPDPSEGEGLVMERFSYDDAIVRKFVLATWVWGFVGMLVGVIVALQLVLPSLVDQLTVFLELAKEKAMQEGTEIGLIPQLVENLLIPYIPYAYQTEWLSFGRLRPLHTNAAIFAFAGNAIFAAVYYSTQRLCKARMWSDLLSNLNFWGWQAIIVSAAITIPLGFTTGKEYAELEWPIDLAIAVVWLGFFGTNFFMTLLRRRERHLYVALWFYIATIVTVTILHVFNSLAVPAGPLKSYSIYAGAQDALVQWWYGHNAVAFFLTTPFLGLMYYFLPKAAGRPVYSYKLSIVHFWSLVFIYIWAGPHHLHYTALPEWASTLGMVFSVMLWMPSWGGMINGLLTLRGAWQKVAADPVLKFFVVGVTFYGMSTFEGPMLSLKSVNQLSHYTDWTIGHVHGGTLGWNGMMTFGMLYWLAPRLFQSGKLWSKGFAEWHFWLATIGIFMYWISMQWAGITQGLMWRSFEAGALVYPDFVETVNRLIPLYWIRAVGGALFLFATVLGGINLLMTWMNRPSKYEIVEYEAPALKRKYVEPASYKSDLPNVISFGRAGDQITNLSWHRRFEGLPFKFTLFVIISVVIASAFSLVPMFVIKSNVPTISTVEPYTPLELYGRDIYIAEGCYNCHSQMIRPIWAETVRYGEYSKSGESVYDHPFQWGSRRIGPDLARIGGKYSDEWHVRHMENPRAVVTGSLMPSYPHLLVQNTDWDQIRRSVDAMVLLDVPYTDEERANSVEIAQGQAQIVLDSLEEQHGGPYMMKDKDGNSTHQVTVNNKIIPLVAYLQRVGIDITKTPEEAESAE
ncbi:MAG: cytochrome-c oxidase, cbb3-type subunit I [Planctomycetota bacterium]